MDNEKSKKDKPFSLVWYNVSVPDSVKGAPFRKNIAILCYVAVPINDYDGNVRCVRIYGGDHDGLEISPAYGTSIRRNAPRTEAHGT